ncbi:MAG: hypothetical protein NDI77_12710 [Geobacteraceae bacterium]|nr:hypothetical protein [Geobacteraceae bacterium]
MNSNPNGIACTTGNCIASFPFGTPVTLFATFSADSLFSGWSGACTNATGDCTVTMDADKSVTATFNTLPPFRIQGTQMSYFQTFLDAYTAAQTGNPTTVHARRVEVTENINLNRNVPLFLKGGFDGSFTANDGFTTIHGILTIGVGSLTVENVIVK